MWDTHCHLSDFKKNELPKILQKAKNQGVNFFVTSASSFDNFDANIQIAQEFENVFLCLGLHPLFLPNSNLTASIEKLRIILQTHLQNNPKKLVALGEIGLDFRAKLNLREKTKQMAFFEAQLRLAEDLNIPTILHIQKAHQKAIEILQKTNFTKGGTVHAFNSGKNEAEFYRKKSFKLGVGTNLLNSKSHKLLAKIKRLALDSIVLETDAPFMSPFANLQNSPEYLPLLAEKLAEVFSQTKEQIIKTSSKNAEILFANSL